MRKKQREERDALSFRTCLHLCRPGTLDFSLQQTKMLVDGGSSSDIQNCKQVSTPWLCVLHTRILPLLALYLYTYSIYQPQISFMALTSDDSIYRKYRYIIFDMYISYRIVKKISNFLIYCVIFYLSRYFWFIAIYYTSSLYFYHCITKITRINGENDKLTETN